ncbi:MAG: hypothetical protein IJL89_03800 [Firmicutes bacterium]|nr:hypothetical protein [Bacillota bacterium]
MTEQKQNIKIYKYVLCLIIPIILGIILLNAVYLLPAKNVEKHVVDAFSFFYDRSFAEEGYEPSLLEQRDDFTDLIILTNCFARRPEDPFYKAALRGTYIGYLMYTNDPLHDVYHPFYGMLYYTFFGSGYSYADYSRYWHGYQVILIPLFEVFGYKTVIALNYILFFTLSAAAVVIAAKCYGILRGAAYAGMIISLSPVVIPMCLQYSAMAYITLISSIIFCLIKKDENIPLLFMSVGTATAYFDFLTYPALALCVLCTLYIIEFLNKKNALQIIKSLFAFSFLWALGYGVMFVAKWVITAAVLGGNEFSYALSSAIFRVNGAGYSILDALTALKDTLAETAALPVLGAALLMTAASLLYALKQKETKFCGVRLLLFLIPPAITLAWFLVIRNHSIQHKFLSVRNCAAIWFALFSLVSSIKTSN